jgi:predicted regulator of Ras-like GTPase activity (Roadblock/LC7/MglB family)
MTDDEFNAQVEAELNKQIDAELRAEMAAKRLEIARRLRREATSREYDRINARHPIQGRGDPKAEAARVAAMRAGAARDAEWMARVNSRPIEGSLVHQRKRAALTPGSEGFKIKG